MRLLVAMSLAAAACVAVPEIQWSDAVTLEREFAPGGQIRMDLSAGEYDITGSADNRIRLDWTVEDLDRLRDVRNAVDIRGTDARITTDGPKNFDVRIQIPARSDLVVHVTAGEVVIRGIEGNKDIELHAGELDIDVRPEDYGEVDASIWAGEIHATPLRIMKEGIFRSLDWKGTGRYRLHAHLKAGELRLNANETAK
jgi:hypothetical protein